MDNAQEAIEEYEHRASNARSLDTVITPNPDKRVTMILDFKYEDGSCFYLAQRQDGKQKWVQDPDPDVWHDVIQDYWYNEHSPSEGDEP